MEPIETNIQLPYIKLAAKVWGKNKDSPIIALHGWLDNANSFDLVAPLIKNHQVIAIDLAGHGFSEHRPIGSWYHFTDYLIDLSHIISSFNIKKATLLGHSLGGAIAATFAAGKPEVINKLILIEALGPLSTEAEKSSSNLHAAIEAVDALPNKKTKIFSSPQEAILARAKVNGFDRDTATLLISRGLKSVNEGYTWRTDPKLMLPSPVRMVEEQVTNLLNHIEAQALLINSEENNPFSINTQIDQRIKHIKNQKHIQLPGSHHLHLEYPQQIAAAINHFLNE